MIRFLSYFFIFGYVGKLLRLKFFVIIINLIKMLNSSKMSAFMLSSKYSCNPTKQVNRLKQVSNKITHVRAASYMSTSFQMNKLPFYQHAMNPAANGFVQKRQFSLPSHIKLEMPNLSPTMEKVSYPFLIFNQTLAHCYFNHLG